MVTGGVNPRTGFVMDFSILKAIVQPLIDRLDHRHLNHFVRYPSSEYLAVHIAHYVLGKLDAEYSSFQYERLVVSVSETENTWAEWDSNDPEDMRMVTHASEEEEWMFPKVPYSVSNVDEAIEGNKQVAAQHWECWNAAQALAEQLQLYKDTMNPNPVLPDFKKAKEEEEQAKQEALRRR